MKKNLLLIYLSLISYTSLSQTVVTDPSFPKADEAVTFTINAEGTSLEGYTDDVWIWTWINQGCSTGCDAPTNVDPATSEQSDALMSRSESNPDVYTITFIPTEFFNKQAEELIQIGLKLKTRDWADNIQTDNDIFVDFNQGQFAVDVSNPQRDLIFVNSGDNINFSVSSNESATFNLFKNDQLITTLSDSDNFNYNYNIAEDSGDFLITLEVTNGSTTFVYNYQIIVRSIGIDKARPSWVKEGINYRQTSDSVTLVLKAPNNESVYLINELTDYEVQSDFQFLKDGEYYWLSIGQFEAGKEYPTQYLVDETVYIADPYADKILDIDDQYIPEDNFSNLTVYPEELLRNEWYFNRSFVIQTGQEEYQWNIENFEKPIKKDLVIYELLVRDFLETGSNNYKVLKDSIGYFKELGVNAIQLMPVMEFNGNISWGYNGTFMFAPDKYYGSKNDLKAFIDACHAEGIAVILDIALNHQDVPSPLLMMDFNDQNFTPSQSNLYFNQEAKHPFNVFFDMNHESTYTQHWMDSINQYWLNEFKIDGFRFDLSKGFTQTNSGDNVGQWSSYDASRIALLKRMSDNIWENYPDTYVILEHFADNTEETELANYGMMLWGNMHYSYNQLALGYEDGSNVDYGYYGNRGWQNPNLISYIESHDEERLLYNLYQNGNSQGSYSTKSQATALERAKLSSALFYTVPGPKMLWQFGEFGYDVSINENGRTGEKPLKWNYLDSLHNARLFNFNKELIDLKTSLSVFKSSDINFNNNGNYKSIVVKYELNVAEPTDLDQASMVIVANTGVVAGSINIQFPYDGDWYHYFAGGDAFQANGEAQSIFLQPGEFRIYFNYQAATEFEELINYSSPKPVSNLQFTETDSAGIRIQWIDNSIIENGFKLFKSISGDNFEEVESTLKNGTFIYDADVKPQENYGYFVRAFNSYGYSDSDTISVTGSSILSNIKTKDSALRIFPNPASNMLKAELPSHIIKGIEKVKIFDLTGKLMPFEYESYEDKLFIDISTLSNGFFTIQVFSQSSIFRSNFVKK